MSHKHRRQRRLENINDETPSRPWSDLPSDLLAVIAGCLNRIYDDIKRFRSVCKSWRNSIPASYPLYPLLLEKFPAPGGPYNKFSTTAVYLLRQRNCKKSWLASIQQSCDEKLLLLHPITGVPVETEYQHALGNLDSIRVVSRSFSVINTLNKDVLISGPPPAPPQWCGDKVILWPYPTVKNLPQSPQDYLYVALGRFHSSPGPLVCYEIFKEKYYGCNSLTCGSVTRFNDIVLWRRLIYAVDEAGRLYRVSYDGGVDLISKALCKDRKQKQLMVWEDDLYLVKWKQGAIKVYKLITYQWDELNTLGDLILFIRPHSCFFVHARDLSGCQENSVVYICDEPKSGIPENVSSTCRMFQEAVRVYKYGSKKSKPISSCPEFCDVLWPPLSWFNGHSIN